MYLFEDAGYEASVTTAATVMATWTHMIRPTLGTSGPWQVPWPVVWLGLRSCMGSVCNFASQRRMSIDGMR